MSDKIAINSNMGCIEIDTDDGQPGTESEINSNMGCIEISVILFVCVDLSG